MCLNVKSISRLCVILLSAAYTMHPRPAAASESLRANPIDFNRDIEPILADNCYSCHGPDPGGRKASLRLDRPDIAYAKLKDDKIAVVKGDIGASEMIRRIESADPDVHMPPAPHDSLKSEQVAVLREWISQGAVYRNHWSFEKPVRPSLPVVKNPTWARNPVDYFILSGLDTRGVVPSPVATKRELIRRVTLDLTGLLPTPAEVDAFAADNSADAYEKVVDRLLASPRFGEHRVHYWLDYVRYADTHGLHNDNYREIWPYRDYVINAFNANKPFDQFAIEQIAGDLLPRTNVDQVVATGFVRSNLSTGEGGAIDEELVVSNKRDRVEAYGTAFLGLTAGCAVCHDHKFDPITQKNFYQLTAYFNNLEENPSNKDLFAYPPVIQLPKAENREAYNKILAEKAEIQGKGEPVYHPADDAIKEWLASSAAPHAVSTDAMVMRLRFNEGSGDVARNAAPHAESEVYRFSKPPAWDTTTRLWPSVRFDGTTKLESPRIGDFERDQAFSGGAWVYVADAEGAVMSRMDTRRNYRGWDMRLDAGVPMFHLIDTFPNNLIRIESETKLSKREWHHLSFTYDGSSKAAGVKLFADGRELKVRILNDTLTQSTRAEVPWELGRRYDTDVLTSARFHDVRLYSRALTPGEVAHLPYEEDAAEIAQRPIETWTGPQHQFMGDFYSGKYDPTKSVAAKVEQLDKQLATLSAGGPVSMVCQEKAGMPSAYVLSRGAYTVRLERVTADTPDFLPKLKDAPANRLGLAEWTVSPENPLTARVAVNRMWQELFGTGIVETSGDFGMAGSRPSNQPLLDWLAVEFMTPTVNPASHPWDIKHMYRLLVTSAAYRQSANISPDLLEKDPQNRWIVLRGPLFRMDAEMLRDTALQSAGLLVEKIGGPSVKPYHPAGVWEAVRGLATNPGTWVQDKGEGTYRRSMYTFWKRQATVPDMDAFNSPLRDVACTRRDRTNTPLQALVLWNDPQWVEASRMLAQCALKEGGDSDKSRLDFIAGIVLARSLQPEEQTIFQASVETFQKHYAADSAAATDLLQVGDTRSDASLSKSDLAGWTLVASQFLNSDEALNK